MSSYSMILVVLFVVVACVVLAFCQQVEKEVGGRRGKL